MREFSQVQPSFWTGDTGKRIKGDPDSQVVALYLLTNPHANALGLYYLPLPFGEHETGLSQKKIVSAFKKLTDFCRYDAASEFVWVINMAAFQIGNLKLEDNRLKPLRRAWQALAPNPFIGPFFEKYGERFGFERRACRGLTGGPTSPTPSPQIIETEMETEREIENTAPASGADQAPSQPKILTPLQLIVRAWKIQTGADPDDEAWDKAHFKRHCRPAQSLLNLFGGDVDAAVDCIEDVYQRLVTDKNLDLSLQGVVNNSGRFRQEWSERKEKRRSA